MRILMLDSIPRESFGGVERWMVRTAAGLIGRGHSVHVMALPDSRLLQRCGAASVPAHPIRFGFDFSPISALRVAALARRERLEIAITNFNKELRLVALARRWSPVRRAVMRSVLPMMDTAPRYRRLYGRHLDGMITPSRGVKQAVEEYAWMAGVRVQNIPNGVDLEDLDRRKLEAGGRDVARRDLGLPADAFVVGAVGRMEPHKGMEHLVEAFGVLKGRYPGARLLLVGDGSQLQALRLRAAGITPGGAGIHLAGYQSEVLPYLLAMDVLVLPSTTPYETFGQSLVEAMACHLPVVGSEVGGIPEVVSHDRNGLLVPPGDESALVAALARLAADPALRRRLARNGRQTVERDFREDLMLDRVEAYLQGLLEGGD